MRRLLLVALLLVLPTFSFALPAEQIVKVAPGRVTLLLEYRQATLESISGIDVDTIVPSLVVFEYPADIDTARWYGFGVRYYPQSGLIVLNPKYYAPLNRWLGDDPDSVVAFLQVEDVLCHTLDHELGHYFTYRIAVQLGQRTWYDSAHLLAMSSAQRVGAKILTEGLGTYFGRLTLADRRPHGQALMPSNWRDQNWYSRSGFDDICFESGYSIVQPIIDQYHQRGMEYILSHPLEIPDGDLYSAAALYQKAAFTDLAVKP